MVTVIWSRNSNKAILDKKTKVAPRTVKAGNRVYIEGTNKSYKACKVDG